MIRWAVLAPMPFTRFMASTSPDEMASDAVAGSMALKMSRAVLAPTPFTPKSSKNKLRSSAVANPYSNWASSRTTMWVWILTNSWSPNWSKVVKLMATKYPTPPHSTTTCVGCFSTRRPCK